MGKKLNCKDFINFWKEYYYDPKNQDEKYYFPHLLKKIFKPEDIICLLKWKLQNTYRFHAKRYEKLINENINQLNSFKNNKDANFNDFFVKIAEKFSKQLPIKIFILHICQPNKFPIIDQYTYRSFIFLTRNKIIKGQIPSGADLSEYQKFRKFIFEIQRKTNLNLRDIDRALMIFGAFLNNPKKSLNTNEKIEKFKKI